MDYLVAVNTNMMQVLMDKLPCIINNVAPDCNENEARHLKKFYEELHEIADSTWFIAPPSIIKEWYREFAQGNPPNIMLKYSHHVEARSIHLKSIIKELDLDGNVRYIALPVGVDYNWVEKNPPLYYQISTTPLGGFNDE